MAPLAQAPMMIMANRTSQMVKLDPLDEVATVMTSTIKPKNCAGNQRQSEISPGTTLGSALSKLTKSAEFKPYAM